MKSEALARIDDPEAKQLLGQLSTASAADSAAKNGRDTANTAREAACNNPSITTLDGSAQAAEKEAARLEAEAKIAGEVERKLAEVLGRALKSKRDEVLQFRSCTRQWALPLGMTLGCILAAIGARILHTLIDPASTVGLGSHQTSALEVGDILLSGIVLAGGSDPIHKLMDLYRKFMESSSAKATAAK